jgi:hypothetical protein
MISATMDVAFDKRPIDVVVGLPRLLFVVPLCRVNAPSCGFTRIRAQVKWS